jgi:hypothetical protein
MLPTTDGPWTLERQITPEHRAAEQHTALGPNPYKVSVSS